MKREIRTVRDWLVAADPGMTRLRQAFNAAVAMGTSLGIEFLLARVTGGSGLIVLIEMLLGAVMAMMGSVALAGSQVREKIKTGAAFPIAVGAGMALGILASFNTDVMLSVFVVVMFVAVAIRRFGVAYFSLGFMGWMGYFIASFTKASWADWPMMMIAVIVAAAWMVFLFTTVLKTRPRRTLFRTLNAFFARARAVAEAIRNFLSQPDGLARENLRLVMRTRSAQLSETALMVEGWLAERGAVPSGWSPLAVRRRLLDIQHVMDRMAADALALAAGDSDTAALAAALADAIARQDDVRAAQLVAHFNEVEGPMRWAALDFSDAAAVFIAMMAEGRAARQSGSPMTDDEEFVPAAALAMENLPGSPAAVRDVPAVGGSWNPLARMDFPLRQAVQVAVAGGLAIVFGRWVSPERYYWAVIAAFIMSAGTATRVEAALKGVDRVVGTMVGLVAAVAIAAWTAGHIAASLVVIILAMFLGFYLVRVSYAYMIFFLTIMLGQLYSILHELSTGLLLVRLEETAIGAASGIVVALFVVPLSARDTIESARLEYLSDLQSFLETASESFDGRNTSDLDSLVRSLENRYRVLVQMANPVTPPLAWGFSRPAVRHRLGMYAALTGYVRTLAVALRDSAPDDRTQTLHQACRILADSVDTVTKITKGAPVVHLDTPPGLDASRLNPIGRPLNQIYHLLDDFVSSEPL